MLIMSRFGSFEMSLRDFTPFHKVRGVVNQFECFEDLVVSFLRLGLERIEDTVHVVDQIFDSCYCLNYERS
jgi:hypothetical protein